MPRDGTKNLIPFDKRTESEQREIRSKGGKTRTENFYKRKTLKEELLALLSDNGRQQKISLALLEKAIKGDTKAFEVIRDTVGEKPKEVVEQVQEKPFEVNIKVLSDDKPKQV